MSYKKGRFTVRDIVTPQENISIKKSSPKKDSPKESPPKNTTQRIKREYKIGRFTVRDIDTPPKNPSPKIKKKSRFTVRTITRPKSPSPKKSSPKNSTKKIKREYKIGRFTVRDISPSSK